MLRHTVGPARPNCFGRTTTRSFADWLLQIVGFAFALCIATPAFAGTWTQLGNLHTPRSNASVAMLPNGLVLVAGGVIGATALSSAELYDPATGIFTVTGSLTAARQRATATMLANGTVLIAGGTNTSGSLASAEIYDPANGSFIATGSLTSARSHATATLLADGRVLLVGGISASASLASAELYDASSGQFASTGSLQASRYAATSALLPDGRVLIAGGHTTDPSSASIGTTEIYDPANGVFSAGAALTSAREAATATLLANGKVLIAGGVMQSHSLRSAELYDPVAGTSVATGSMTDPRDSAIAAALPSGMVLLAGGNSAGSYLTRAEIYNPATGTFSSAGSMLNARADASAALLPNAQVLVIGGVNSSGSVARVESYDSTSGTFASTGSMSQPCESAVSAPLPDGRVLVLGCELDQAQLYDPATGSFTSPGTTQRRNLIFDTLTLLGDGRVLVASGLNAGTTSELYDPLAGTFALTGPTILNHYLHTATLLANGEVLIAGGIDSANGQAALSGTEIYNPVTHAFREANAMLTARAQATATLLPNGKVLLAGGTTGGSHPTAMAAAELYDPASNTFASTGALNTARSLATATLLPNGTVLIAGGFVQVGPVASAELYDPATGTFSATGSMATARSSATGTLLASGKVLIAGGYNAGITNASVELYDPATGLFSTAGTMTAPRQSAAATLLPNGKVLIAGGFAYNTMGQGIGLTSAELYDPGLGFADTRRAQIGKVELTAPTQPLALNFSGNGFRASTEQSTGALLGSEASSGDSQSTATNFPLLQLRRIDNDQQFFIGPDSARAWTDSSFVSSTQSGLPLGYYRATLYVNGIPSQSRLLSVAPRIKVTAIGGDQQAATVNAQFAQPLQAVVTDPSDNPIQGVTANFSCSPASSGACIYQPGSLTSDANGLVSGLITANTKSGTYSVQITSGSDSVPATFSLSNIPGAATSLSATGVLTQSTQVNTAFASALQVKLTDTYNNPVSGATVTFAATPVNGATAILPSAAPTDANGATSVTAAANIVAGSYVVHANLGTLTTQFNLTNTPGPAANIVADNGPDFDGIAGLALASAPAVEVTDSFGNTVSGIDVTFATTGTDSGSITESDTLTDSTGFANAGSWTLAPDPGTNTLQASAPGLTGSPVQFSAIGSASVDIAVSVTNNRGFVQFGHTLDYVIVVTATGPSNAHDIQVTDVLPAQVDAANARWVCIPAIGAACAASGTGNLVNEVADVPSGSSVTFVLSATVLNDQQILDNTITNTVNAAVGGDTDTSNNVLTVVTEAVIFRNGFEAGGDGSN